MRQATEKKRKNPRQKRARETIDTIMEATAQLLERSGHGGFTTNHIARRAGYSIGTLYRYFPHKKAILKQIVESELRRQEAVMRDAMAQSTDTTGENLIAHAVRTMLHPFRAHTRARKTILLELIHDVDFTARIHAAQIQIMHMFHTRLHESDPERFRQPSDLLTTTLTGALLGCIRTTFYTEPEHLSSPDYERELIDMVTHFVTAKNPA